MLETIATFTLGALVAAFAVFAVLLNESEHAARRRLRRRREAAPVPEGAEALDLTGEPAPRDGRRLPVGDFLFGALFLRGEEPLAFADLAASAADAGLDISQTLAWLDRAQESGLVERVDDSHAAQAAVRLTELGMDVARNNRRGVPAEVRAQNAGAPAHGADAR